MANINKCDFPTHLIIFYIIYINYCNTQVRNRGDKKQITDDMNSKTRNNNNNNNAK